MEGHDAARPLRGHPVAIRASVLRRLYREEALPLRQVLATLDTAILDLPACAARDLDTPEDLEAATGKRPVFSVDR
jgi:CTP:molybdopterin cytidylyltransferase MocA